MIEIAHLRFEKQNRLYPFRLNGVYVPKKGQEPTIWSWHLFVFNHRDLWSGVYIGISFPKSFLVLEFFGRALRSRKRLESNLLKP
jgi:hypothetical protein